MRKYRYYCVEVADWVHDGKPDGVVVLLPMLRDKTVRVQTKVSSGPPKCSRKGTMIRGSRRTRVVCLEKTIRLSRGEQLAVEYLTTASGGKVPATMIVRGRNNELCSLAERCLLDNKYARISAKFAPVPVRQVDQLRATAAKAFAKGASCRPPCGKGSACVDKSHETPLDRRYLRR